MTPFATRNVKNKIGPIIHQISFKTTNSLPCSTLHKCIFVELLGTHLWYYTVKQDYLLERAPSSSGRIQGKLTRVNKNQQSALQYNQNLSEGKAKVDAACWGNTYLNAAQEI